MEKITLQSRTNHTLNGYLWRSDKPKANVVIAHGMVEHSLRYDEFNLFLNRNGYNVYMFDHIGHGANM